MQIPGYISAHSYAAKFVAVAVLYGALLVLSFHLIPSDGMGASLVWPPAAFGLMVLLFWGLDLWPALAFATFVVLYVRGVYPPLIAVRAVANIAEALIGAYILKNYIDFSPMMNRLKDALGLILAAVAASAASASIVTVGVFIFNQGVVLNSVLWTGLWIGHTVSLLSFGPFALRWVYRLYFTKTRIEVLEGIAVFGSIFVFCVLLFWTPYSSIAGISFLYIMIIPFIWAALRTGPRGISLALFMLATIGSTGVLFGFGPITQSQNLSTVLFGIQMIIGTLSVIFLLFTSITEERKEAVNNLQAHVGKLEVALEKISSEDQAKTDFIAILAHELRNPLSPLLSGLEILKLEEKGRPEVLKMMGTHLHMIALLLDDLLDISRISQKKFRLQKEPVEVHQVIAHTLEMAQPHLSARGHTLVTNIADEEIWVNGDPVRLSQIFVNLLNNSAKYTNAGGTVILTVRADRDDLLVSVKDNGIGIAPERLNKVFEPFGNLEDKERRSGGLHIGLSLAKRMVEMHHGTIKIESEGIDRGSEVTVRIPAMLTAPLPLAAPTKTPSRSRFSKKEPGEEASRIEKLRILVVDDNEPAARGMAKLLEYYGHEVLIAHDAPEALVLAAQHRPYVAILDIGLPTMDGYQLVKAMRAAADYPLTCIALTGYGQPEDKQKAKEAGFEGYLVKPVSIVDVERVLLDLLKR